MFTQDCEPDAACCTAVVMCSLLSIACGITLWTANINNKCIFCLYYISKRMFSTRACRAMWRRRRIHAERAFPCYLGVIHRVQCSCCGSQYGFGFIGNCKHVNTRISHIVNRNINANARLRAWCCLLHGRGHVFIALDRVLHHTMDRKHK